MIYEVMLVPHATKHALIPKQYGAKHLISTKTAATDYSNLQSWMFCLLPHLTFLSKPIFLEAMDLRGHQDMVKAESIVEGLWHRTT